MKKTCSVCKLEKNVGDFFKATSSKDGYYHYCKICSNEKAKLWQKKMYPFRKDKLKISREKYRAKLSIDNPYYWKQKTASLNLQSRKKIIEGYGGKCKCCGESHYEFLAIDHVNNDGNEDRKIRKNQQILSFILKNNFPSQYQILCHNCNMSKSFHGYCPHDHERK